MSSSSAAGVAPASDVGDAPVCAPASDVGCSVLSGGLSQLHWLLSNCRGFKQAAGDLKKVAAARRPDFIALNETFLRSNESVNQYVPKGYKIAARFDRVRGASGGSQLVLCRQHLLVDQVDCSAYSVPSVAELIGVSFNGVLWILCYTPDSRRSVELLRVCSRFLADHPAVPLCFLGDFNAHNPGWIPCTSKCDAAGVAVQEFAEACGFSQLVDFPKREGNALDLIICDVPGVAAPLPGLGPSDHLSVWASFAVEDQIRSSPKMLPHRLWHSAPWVHIRGAVSRVLEGWDPRSCGSVDAAERDLDGRLSAIVEQYAKLGVPKLRSQMPWWTPACDRAYKHKLAFFEYGLQDPVMYRSAIKKCRRVNRRAYKRWQLTLRFARVSWSWAGQMQISGDLGRRLLV